MYLEQKVSDGFKVSVSKFKRNVIINNLNGNKLRAIDYRKGVSNILNILDKYV